MPARLDEENNCFCSPYAQLTFFAYVFAPVSVSPIILKTKMQKEV